MAENRPHRNTVAGRTLSGHRRPTPAAALTRSPELVDAACRGVDPELFFPERRTTGDRGEQMAAHDAKSICRTCPARTPCLVVSIARGEWEGIWGGHTPGERRALVRDAVALRHDVRATVQALEHGTRFPPRPGDFLAVVHELTILGWGSERIGHVLGLDPDTVVRARARAGAAAAVLAAMGPGYRSEPAAA